MLEVQGALTPRVPAQSSALADARDRPKRLSRSVSRSKASSPSAWASDRQADASRAMDRGLSSKELERAQRRNPLVTRQTCPQDLAAPYRPGRPVAGAIPGHGQHLLVEQAVLGHARRRVGVVVLYSHQR